MRNHYVPQFLLRAWAETSGDNKLEAFRIDRPNIPSSRLPPKSTGYEDDLYALTLEEVAGTKKHEVETDFLQKIDSDSAIVRKKMIIEGLTALTRKDRFIWASFLICLRARTPDSILILNKAGTKHLRATLLEKPEEYDAIAEPTDPSTLNAWVEQHVPGFIANYGLLFLPEFVTNSDLVEKILFRTWWIIKFEKRKEHLLLSDRPCIFTSGLDDPDCIVALPIDPWTVFMITLSDRVSSSVRRQDPDNLLVKINQSSLNNSQKRTYARDRSPHQFISEHITRRNSEQEKHDSHHL